MGEFYIDNTFLNEYSNMVTLKLTEKTFFLPLVAPELNYQGMKYMEIKLIMTEAGY